MNTDMKKQTAVDSIIEFMKNNQYFIGNDLYEFMKQAKAMEKEQILDAHWDGSIYWDSEKTEEQYYTKTYGGDK
jgi:hypothetical protein